MCTKRNGISVEVAKQIKDVWDNFLLSLEEAGLDVEQFEPILDRARAVVDAACDKTRLEVPSEEGHTITRLPQG